MLRTGRETITKQEIRMRINGYMIKGVLQNDVKSL